VKGRGGRREGTWLPPLQLLDPPVLLLMMTLLMMMMMMMMMIMMMVVLCSCAARGSRECQEAGTWASVSAVTVTVIRGNATTLGDVS